MSKYTNVYLEGEVVGEVETATTKNGNEVKTFFLRTKKDAWTLKLWKSLGSDMWQYDLREGAKIAVTAWYSESNSEKEAQVKFMRPLVAHNNKKDMLTVAQINENPPSPGAKYYLNHGWCKADEIVEDMPWLEFVFQKLGEKEVSKRFKDWYRENNNNSPIALDGFKSKEYKLFKQCLIEEAKRVGTTDSVYGLGALEEFNELEV